MKILKCLGIQPTLSLNFGFELRPFLLKRFISFFLGDYHGILVFQKAGGFELNLSVDKIDKNLILYFLYFYF